MTMRITGVACVLGLVVGVVVARGEENWTQFRGVGGQGRSDAKGVVVNIGEGENVKW